VLEYRLQRARGAGWRIVDSRVLTKPGS